MGIPVVEGSTAIFQRNQLTFAAWILAHRFLQQLRRPSLFSGLDYWTGLLDWTTGLDYWTHENSLWQGIY